MRIRQIIYCSIVSILFITAACGQAPKGLNEKEVVSTSKNDVKFRVETVAAVSRCRGFCFSSEQESSLHRTPGRVRLIENGALRADPSTWAGCRAFERERPDGLSIHPDFKTNNFVYLAYAYNKDGKRVKVVRYKLDAASSPIQRSSSRYPSAPNHAGRVRVRPDGKLYVVTGDSTNWNLAQDNNSLAGKTLRLNDDGSVPTDNPFVGKSGYRPEISRPVIEIRRGWRGSPEPGDVSDRARTERIEGKGGGADEVNFVEREELRLANDLRNRTQAGTRTSASRIHARLCSGERCLL